MENCIKCGRLVAGQMIATNQKFIGRDTTKFFCLDCLCEWVGVTKEQMFSRIHDFIEIEKCALFDVEVEHTKDYLYKAQALPLKDKIGIAAERITEWYLHYDGQVYVSFSGGKDSTVLLHLARQLFPDIEAVFVNTGLEYPEIQKFVKGFDNVTILRPKMRFDEVIKKYGYPLISKEIAAKIYDYRKKPHGYANDHFNPDGKYVKKYGQSYCLEKWVPLRDSDIPISSYCCNVMKKNPTKAYAKKTGKKMITAQMACESRLRKTNWLRAGCNAFDNKNPVSNPMSIWTEQDVLLYIKSNNLAIASVYGDVLEESNSKLTTSGCDRTGCIFCAFGCHLEKEPSRFQRLKETHPRQYEYCIGGGEYDENGRWVPNKEGLGMGHVFDEVNKLYGEDFIKY